MNKKTKQINVQLKFGPLYDPLDLGLGPVVASKTL
jgi:hypothetical protein